MGDFGANLTAEMTSDGFCASSNWLLILEVVYLVGGCESSGVDAGLVNLLSKLAELERKRLAANGLAQCPSMMNVSLPCPHLSLSHSLLDLKYRQDRTYNVYFSFWGL